MIENIRKLSSFFWLKDKSLKYYVFKTEEQYSVFYLTQKNGKKRKITTPNLSLQLMQNKILHQILNKHQRLDFVFGFYKDTNHIENAKYHQDSKEMLNIDIKDFFESINTNQVYFVFNKIFEFDSKISTILTRLTTYRGSLPQGASTSPALSNLVFRNCDYRIKKLADKIGVKYSRYADDLTFSSEKPFNKKYLLKAVESILKDNNFQINKSKTRFLSNHLFVTGLSIIDGEIKIPRYYIRDIEQQFYYIEKFGLSNHVKNVYGQDKDVDVYLEQLYGRIVYVFQVEKTLGKQFLTKFSDLIY